MNVVISPNIKKESVRIDTSGNIINPRTKEVLQSNAPEYVPTMQEINANIAKQDAPKTDSMSDKINAMVEAKIAEKIDAIVAKRVEEALKNL